MTSDWVPVLFLLLFITLCCIGTVLNAVLLVVFARHPETRTPENILLINLCISDLAYLLSFLTAPKPSSVEVKCYAFVIIRCFTIALNTYSVAAISVQRYVGLVTYKVRLPTDKTDYVHSLLIVAGVWITAVVLAAMEVLFINQGKYHNNNNNCFLIGVSVYRIYMYGVIPSAITSVFYIAAAWRVNRSVLQLPGVQCEALQKLRQQRKKSARILLALAVVFLMTYIPMLVFTYIIRVSANMSYWLIPSFLIAHLMCTLNPIFNPIALCVASRQLRELYHKYCCCCCCRTPVDSTTSRITHDRNATVEEETEF